MPEKKKKPVVRQLSAYEMARISSRVDEVLAAAEDPESEVKIDQALKKNLITIASNARIVRNALERIADKKK